MIGAESNPVFGPLDPRGDKSRRWRQKVLGCLALAALLAATLGAAETLAQRRRRVEAMSVEQRDELFRNEKDFRGLPAADQRRMWDLHDEIESSPDRDKLRAVMNRYSKWVEAQKPFRRSTLSDKKKTANERVAIVKEFLKKPLGQAIGLDDKDRQALTDWLDRYTKLHAARFLENLANRPGIAKLKPEQQLAVLRENLLRRWLTPGPNGQLPFADMERAGLLAAISPELRAKLQAKKPEEQAQIIAEWIRETASRSSELDEQLCGYFVSTINDENGYRDWLMSLPVEEMDKNLSAAYSAHLKQSKLPEPPWGDRGKRGHRPGGGPPRGSGGRRSPENRDDKDIRTATDARDAQERAASESTTGKPSIEKKTNETPPAKTPAE